MDDASLAAKTCAVVLAGGAGTRIRHLYPGVPKPFIPAAGRPFIAWVLRHLADEGVRRAVVSLGHLAEIGEAALADCGDVGLSVRAVREPAPLGTGGGFLFAAETAPDAELFVLANGDSLVMADFEPVWRRLEDPRCDGVLLGIEMSDASRYGRLLFDADARLVSFLEKQPGAGVINAGVYFLRKRVLPVNAPRTPLSMETELIPSLLARGARLEVCVCSAPFLDIGTPETIEQAGEFIADHFLSGVKL